VQLANRLGALNEIEFSEFVVKTQAFADAINAVPEFPDMRHEVARARELDQFASAHDAQLSFVLRARQAAWSPGYIQQSAAPQGFVIGAMPGRLVLPVQAPGLPPMLTLGYDAQAAMSDEPERSALREVSLALDVPQVARSEQPLARLREVARQLCDAMDGVLCDPNGQPIPAMAMSRSPPTWSNSTTSSTSTICLPARRSRGACSADASRSFSDLNPRWRSVGSYSNRSIAHPAQPLGARVLRARCTQRARWRVRPAVPAARTPGGRAPRTRHARFTYAARARQRALGPGAGAPCRAHAQHTHRDRHRGQRRAGV